MIGECLKNTAVALGSFDGLHIGHSAVIASALSMRDTGLFPVVLLFDSHPLRVLGDAPDEILQKHIRNRILEDMGVKIVEIKFSDICNMAPEEFFGEILVKQLGAKAVCCGTNYRFGAGGAGDCTLLSTLCEQNSVLLNVTPSVELDGAPVSSTRIRSAIKEGNIPLANAMLGREFRYDGEVVEGDKVGRLMGSPTANQLFESGFIVPASGVYASVVVLDGKEYCGVTNIGIRPTFNKSQLRSETFIEDFSGNIYGKNIEIRLLEHIRGEKKFGSMEELAVQIKLDAERASGIFTKRGENSYV